MPLLRSLRQLAGCTARNEEETKAPGRPAPVDSVKAAAVEPGRPHCAYVEREAERYRQEAVRARGPGEPDQRQTGAARPSPPGTAARNRPGTGSNPEMHRALMAVNAMRLHAAERGWIKPPYSRPPADAGYVETLIRLAHDAGWLAREIPLPVHPGPQHPAIYYTVDGTSNRPVPREDALIRGDYVYTGGGYRLTQDEHILPWRNQDHWPVWKDLKAGDRDICYSLERAEDMVRVMFHWIIESYNFPPLVMRLPLEELHFSRTPPLPEW